MTDPLKDFTNDDWKDLLEEDKPDFYSATDPTYEDKRRWVTVMSQVFLYEPEDTFWRVYWEIGNTEDQEPDFAPWYEQVEETFVTTTVYKRIA